MTMTVAVVGMRMPMPMVVVVPAVLSTKLASWTRERNRDAHRVAMMMVTGCKHADKVDT